MCVLAVNPAAITQSPASFSDDDDRKLKRGVLPKRATQIMKSWLFQHIAVCFKHVSQFIRNKHFSVTLPLDIHTPTPFYCLFHANLGHAVCPLILRLQ